MVPLTNHAHVHDSEEARSRNREDGISVVCLGTDWNEVWTAGEAGVAGEGNYDPPAGVFDWILRPR